VLWLHSDHSFFRYFIATVGHLLPCDNCIHSIFEERKCACTCTEPKQLLSLEFWCSTKSLLKRAFIDFSKQELILVTTTYLVCLFCFVLFCFVLFFPLFDVVISSHCSKRDIRKDGFFLSLFTKIKEKQAIK